MTSRLIGVAMGEQMPRSGLGFKQSSLDPVMRVLRGSVSTDGELLERLRLNCPRVSSLGEGYDPDNSTHCPAAIARPGPGTYQRTVQRNCEQSSVAAGIQI
jgi:hypothetical protein